MTRQSEAITPSDGQAPERINGNIAREDGPTDLPPFVAADYANFLTGSGSDKLADSGVAPLIAAARGYLRLDSSNFATEMRLMNIKMSTKQGKRLQRTLNGPGNDGMQMPWFSLADIQHADKKGVAANPFTFQVRPGRPENNDHGKPVKYEFLAGVGTPLDTHPSVPASWIDTTPIVMIAEGLIKGDSALTSYLHKHGASWDVLKDGSEGASERLTALLKKIPVAERILIISIAGINNTTQNPVDWRSIKMRDREVWIAFDADLDSNIHVWRAAAKLWEELQSREFAGRVCVLSPRVAGGSSIEKTGIDDFLSKIGDWDDLVQHMTTGLPPAPLVDVEEAPKAWRISQDGLSTEECFPVQGGPNGEVTEYRWQRAFGLGARITVTEKRRQPTDTELRTGVFDGNVRVHETADAQVEIEVSWLGADGLTHSALVIGPESVVLTDAPSFWASRGVLLPSALLLHPSWPPRWEKGEKWLSALKANRADEVIRRTRWMQMGWVPVPGGHPVFLAGDQVVGHAPADTAIGGVDDRELNVAGKFGVGEKIPAGDYDDPKYKAQVLADLEIVLNAYIRNKPFTEASTAALILGGALRPVVPLRPKATIFFYGSKGSGKSFAAQRMMAFWARHRSDWADQLPGSAKDTISYIEHCVARTPIWVADDLAPSAVKAQAEQENAKLADLVRNIFNNAAKGRMNANMTSQKSNKPIAQLVITAENALTTPSVKERLIPAFFGPGKLSKSQEPTDYLERIANEDGIPARLTAHLIQHVIWSSGRSDGGWEGYVKETRDSVAILESMVQTKLRAKGAPAGSLKRVSSLAADVIISLKLIGRLAESVGAGPDTTRLFTDRELVNDIVDGVYIAHMDNQVHSLGRSTLRALRALLASGNAHVINADEPTKPPLDVVLENMSLGWVNNTGPDGGLKPGGPCIGQMVSSKYGNVVVFFEDVAFKEAQEGFPDLIQHGHQPSIAWLALWDEGLTPEGMKRRRPNSPIWTHKKEGRPNVTGVPVSVKMLLTGSNALATPDPKATSSRKRICSPTNSPNRQVPR